MKSHPKSVNCDPGSHQRTTANAGGIQSPQGFTLVELLLALALCGIVLSAAFGAVHLSWKYRTAGEAQVVRALVIRGVLQDMTLDLRTAAVPLDSESVENEQAGVVGLPDEVAEAFTEFAEQTASHWDGVADIREQVLEFDRVDQVNPVHFFGVDNCFVMLSASENPRFAAASAHKRTHSRSVNASMSHVVWWWNSGAATRVPFSIRNDQLEYRTLIGAADGRSLARMQLGFDARGAQSGSVGRPGPLTAASGNWTSINDDVREVTFRYSDGRQWQSSWNSHLSRRLPTAVELKLEVGPRADQQRLVIRIPQAAVWANPRSKNREPAIQ